MKRTKQSQKRTKFLLLLLVLTAILSITATYAWFSTQRDVAITGMRLNVETAESMQVSLNGETWTQTITIDDMKQFYGTAASGHQAIKIGDGTAPGTGTNTNYVPTELLPVSTVGEKNAGKMQFVTGNYASDNGVSKITNVTPCSEADLIITNDIKAREEGVAATSNGNTDHPFLVFDMYLRNVSKKTTGDDVLYLNNGSAAWVETTTHSPEHQEGVGVLDTGLEYSVRVGFVRHTGTVSLTAKDDPSGLSLGEQVRTIASGGSDQAAIWEPNYKEHTQYVVDQHKSLATPRVTSTAMSTGIDTFGITQAAAATGVTDETIDVNATEADTTNNYTAKQNVYRAAEYTVTGGVSGTRAVNQNDGTPKKDGTVDENAVGMITTVDSTDAEPKYLGVAANAISKVRVYVWLEGQDPDCIDLASTGDKLNVTIKLTKALNTVDVNSYQ